MTDGTRRQSGQRKPRPLTRALDAERYLAGVVDRLMPVGTELWELSERDHSHLVRAVVRAGELIGWHDIARFIRVDVWRAQSIFGEAAKSKYGTSHLPARGARVETAMVQLSRSSGRYLARFVSAADREVVDGSILVDEFTVSGVTDRERFEEATERQGPLTRPTIHETLDAIKTYRALEELFGQPPDDLGTWGPGEFAHRPAPDALVTFVEAIYELSGTDAGNAQAEAFGFTAR